MDLIESNNYYEKNLNRMIEEQIIARGITDQRVLNALRRVPRHLFVPERYKVDAYSDMPLPIGYGQTISQPYMVAVMTLYLEPNDDHKVLEIGTGSGYQTAILSVLAKEVYTIEVVPELQRRAKQTLDTLGLLNVRYKVGDGSLGWEEYAPFDRIIVTAASPYIPPPLAEQLNIGGVMILPVGERWGQDLLKVIKTDEETLHHENLLPCAFVPLIGEYGFRE